MQSFLDKKTITPLPSNVVLPGHLEELLPSNTQTQKNTDAMESTLKDWSDYILSPTIVQSLK